MGSTLAGRITRVISALRYAGAMVALEPAYAFGSCGVAEIHLGLSTITCACSTGLALSNGADPLVVYSSRPP